jgi:hypothetical protein
MFNYLIRVQLPDRPGALGAVASRIGSVGGDVVSIDILQRDDGVVVDELGVGLAGDNLIDLVSDEILEVDGVSIESVRPIAGPMPDRGSELLDVATALFEQSSVTGLLELLTVRVRQSLVASFAAVIDAGHSVVVASDGRQPDHDVLDAGVGERPDVGVAPMTGAGLILVVVRSDPVLRHQERQWISTMAQLADRSWKVLA